MEINICYASNEKYIEYAMTSILSIMDNANQKNQYEIIILSHDLTAETNKLLYSIFKEKENFKLNLINFEKYHSLVEGYTPCKAITAETNYRLFLLNEDLFKKYDKILYLDCDTIVTSDVANLFNIDLKNKCIGAVPSIDVQIKYVHRNIRIKYKNETMSFVEYLNNHIGIENTEEYFNAGVILFDLKQCKKITSTKEMLNILQNNEYKLADQDVLNFVFKNNTKLLDFKWNYLIVAEQYREEYTEESKQKELLDKISKEFNLIHYSRVSNPLHSRYLVEHYLKYKDKLEKIKIL